MTELRARWPSYFRPDPDDDQKLVALVVQAHDAGLITRRMAVEKLARTFGIENVDAALDALDQERDEKQQTENQAAHMLAGMMGADNGPSADQPTGRDRGAARDDAAQDARRGGRAAAAAAPEITRRRR